jgi:hypothetical protein
MRNRNITFVLAKWHNNYKLEEFILAVSGNFDLQLLEPAWVQHKGFLMNMHSV